jgi:hypothetical protein
VLVDNSVCKRFIEEHKKNLAPRHQRDLPRLYSLIKGITLWNYPQREKVEPNVLRATREDIDLGFKLYEKVKTPNELGLSPEVWDIFKRVIEPTIEKNGKGEMKDFLRGYHKEYGRLLEIRRLKEEILPSLLGAGLLYEDKDTEDRRKKVFYLTLQKQYNKPVWGIGNEEIEEEIVNQVGTDKFFGRKISLETIKEVVKKQIQTSEDQIEASWNNLIRKGILENRSGEWFIHL